MILVLFLFACGWIRPTEGEFLRIHIRADSNDPADQAVKLRVRDAVVRYLTPIVSGLPSVTEAKKAVESRLHELKTLAESVLRANGFSYGVEVSIKREKFPTRTYGDKTLLAGVYDAIVFSLGSGEGDNWWCVAYPDFCFATESEEVEYRSFLKDIMDKRSNYAKNV